MDPWLNVKIVCKDEEGTTTVPNIIGDDISSGKLIIRSSNNSELCYIDGACGGDSPIFIGLTKSRGSQSKKLPIEAGDILAGLQVYGRTKSGKSLGYNHNETPLCGSIMFKVANNYQTGLPNIPTELLIVTGNNDNLEIKLIVDSKGNLKISGNMEIGELIITDKEVTPILGNPKKFVKIIYNNIEYGMPLYQL